ncbi:LysR substrate-binding domain-containing protein [Jeongeupia naejangsanensis]|uniref:LysR family transcriptional regulator n=1 Tax=Jeongeupia naejangsanensis TaxID=613195 RepID=A0ABS2BL22_9NEIS|nr:LysR substrate-binding domain-containing protein [Jeongeupia naejangsanensis]MBM3115686.1 LysR family transcriptional regulator [Jeongeupia naejangsanensis]
MLDLNDMLFFAEVAGQGGFSAASRTLGIPKSRLSRRVAELETRLGVRLLQRTTRKLSLTDAGERYYRHCLAIRDEARAAEEAVQEIQSEPRGTLKVSCPVTLAQWSLAPLLGEFMARYPQVRVNLMIANRAVDVIEEGVDVALRVRPALQDSATLVVKRLGVSRTVLVASPEQLLRQGQPSAPEELSWLDTVALGENDGRTQWPLLGPGGAEYAFSHYPRLVAEDLQTLRTASAGGVGMALLPDFMCRDELKSGALVQVLPDWSPQPGIVHAVYPSRRGLLPAVRALLDFLGERMCDEVAARYMRD